jgi:hypothetical protein
VSAAFNISLYATAGDRSFTLKIGNVVRGGESEAGPYAARAIAGKRALIAKTPDDLAVPGETHKGRRHRAIVGYSWLVP